MSDLKESFWEEFEAYQPDVAGGFRIGRGYSPIKDFESMLRQSGWIGEISYRPMTRWIKKKHNWGRDNDPEGPWACMTTTCAKL